MNSCGMRIVEEKHIPNQVDIIIWSNRIDLLALSNFKGEVQVHRLHWQKVWTLQPPAENILVQSMAWRPDGKALAIGYSSGTVLMVDIEDKEVLNKFDFGQGTSEEFDEVSSHGIPCITWAVKSGALDSATEYNIYEDASIFLPKPSSTINSHKGSENEENNKTQKDNLEETQLNMLIIAHGNGNIFMSIYGKYPLGTLPMSQITKDECGEYKVLDINISDDFSCMQVLYLDKTSNYIHLALVNTSVLTAYCEEMYVVANKHHHIIQLMSQVDKTMISITEAWEHILLEMDTKMACYTSEGGLSADLLELLMLGVPSEDLEIFLLKDLTAKGLKKFGSSVELSYSSIQKLVLRQLNIVGQSLTYYFSELRGLTKVPDRFKIFELDEQTVTAAIKACYAFLNKCLELQQVIDVSMRNYKIFFRWLFVVIVRLLDEQTPSEIVKITQQELTHLADFLYNFDNVQSDDGDGSEKPVKFNLERLGQYLQDQELTLLPDDDDNPWHKFLKENACLLKENDTIFSMMEFKKFSLVQQQNYLNNAVAKVFEVKDKDLSKYFSVLCNFKCHESNINDETKILRYSQMFDPEEERYLTSFIHSGSATGGIYFMSFNVNDRNCTASACKYILSACLLPDCKNSESNMTILDLQFYSTEYLSVLVKHPHEDATIFIQLPIKIALENANEINFRSKSLIFNEKIQRKNLSPLLDSSTYKILEKMDGHQIAVSGPRGVAVVVSNNQRKVRVFVMESNDDDEDDTLDTTPLSQLTHSNDNSQSTLP
ncbi:anaphase-promoting complex subunit 4 [Aricia agestis]|uniref:anaphase-promoting complex subunit 4 n=1 Tax=Aricia agestis TaxID=91739 RepID=UPI001C202498|nr:anaphase-promoting complex subunit 4 [Aricia agestis]